MQCPPTSPGPNGRKFHLVRAAASTSQIDRSIRAKICEISFIKAILMSRCAFSMTLAASAALIEAARNTPPDVIEPYKCATRSSTSGVWPETTLVILSMVCSRSPGLMRSGE